MKNFEKFVVESVIENQFTEDSFGSVGFSVESSKKYIETVHNSEDVTDFYLENGVVTITMKNLVALAANFAVCGAMDSELAKEASEILTK